MKVVARTGDYTIYKKRNQRYAVRNKDKQWVRGEDKVAILLAHNLVAPPAPQAPDHPEPAAGDAPAEGADAAAGAADTEDEGERGA